MLGKGSPKILPLQCTSTWKRILLLPNYSFRGGVPNPVLKQVINSLRVQFADFPYAKIEVQDFEQVP